MLAESGFHTRAFVEWEDWPRAVLIAAQRAGYFAPAPIWDDLRSFDSRPFRGAFDIVLAGYPCQPFSAAGKRSGANDPRHLWPDVARVDREIAAERKRELAMGLDFRRPGSPAQAPGEGGAKDADQDSAKDNEADDTGDEKPDPKEGA